MVSTPLNQPRGIGKVVPYFRKAPLNVNLTKSETFSRGPKLCIVVHLGSVVSVVQPFTYCTLHG